MPKIGGVECEETAPARVRFARDGTASATREFLVPWDRVQEISRNLLPQIVVPNSGGVITTPGESFPGMPGLVVSDIEVEGFDGKNPSSLDENGVTYCDSGCTMTVRYATLSVSPGQTQPGQDGSANLQLEVRGGGNVMYIGPNYNLQEENGPNQFDTPINILISESTFIVTMERMPILPLWDWDELEGCVNSVAMPFLNNAPPETILFEYGSARRTVTYFTDGGQENSLWELTLNFVKHRVRDGDAVRGWNHTYRPLLGWDRPLIKVTGGGERTMYELKDLNRLFVPSVPPPAEEE